MGNTQLVKSITKLIFIESRLEKADLIIVAGSGSMKAPVKVGDLYRKRFAEKVIFTGGFNIKIKRNESEFMRDIAVSKGVRLEDIFLEKRSANTKENATEALRLVNKYKLKHSKIILVALPFHVLRMKMTFVKVFPKSEILIASPKGELVGKNNWWKSRFGRLKVLEELVKIGSYYLKGDLEIF